MSQFIAHGGQFLLDGQSQLIQAGEFHYYRTPVDQWPHRLGLLQAAGFNAVASYIPWLWHQPAEDAFDFDGHSHPMRNLAGFLDLAASMGLLILARPGPYIMAETINEGVPPWVFRRYPQVAFVNQAGTAENVASYLHDDFLACAARWYRAVFAVLAPRQVTRGGKIIMVQLDNEMGMIQWVRNIIDTNPDTLRRFAVQLRSARGDNPAWPPAAGDLVDYLRAGITDPRAPQAAQVVADYRKFYRGYLRDYAAFLWAEARANGLEVPAVINIHGFANGGKPFPIGLSQLLEVIRLDGMISATDVYPGFIDESNLHELLLVNAMTQALQNQQQPLFSIEFQAGGNHDFGHGQASLADLHSRLSISAGMRAINHYLFFGGENDPVLSPVKRHDWGHPVRTDGSLRRHYARYPRLSRVLAAYGQALVLAQPRTVTTIGFQIDDFMTEVNTAATAAATRAITHQRDVILFDMIARGLALTHRPFSALALTGERISVSQAPVLWVMLEKTCPGRVQQALADYVAGGGRLVLTGRMPVQDDAGRPCTILSDALGLQPAQAAEPFTETPITVFDRRDIPVTFMETYAGEFDAAFAARPDGAVVGFTRRIGQGTVVVFGAAMPMATLDEIAVFDELAALVDCPRLFTASSWVDLRISQGEAGSFLFVNNYGDDPVAAVLEYDGQALFGGRPVELAARTGAILPLEWRLNDGITLHYLTSEVVGVTETDAEVILLTAQRDFDAELTLSGYVCAEPGGAVGVGAPSRFRLHGSLGRIVLRPQAAAELHPGPGAHHAGH